MPRSMTIGRRYVGIVERLELPPGLTGSGWPRRQHKHARGYVGYVVAHLGDHGLFVGRLDESAPVEKRRLESV